VPADQPSIIHPLDNDASAAGHVLTPTALWVFNPFEDDGQPWLEGTVNFIEQAPPFGAEYTPPPGFVGPTSFWYADSEIIAGDWIRYDWAKVSLTVGNLPPPPTAVASGSATICAGASTGLTGSGGVSCSWVPATGLDDASSCTPTATPSSTTTYTLTVRDANNQPSTNNPTVTVTVSPLPIAVAGGSATITVGQSTPLFGSGGATCSWSPGIGLDNPGSCTPVASPIVTTTYALAVTSAAGCVSVNPATATITVVPAARADLVTGVLAPLQGRAGQPIPVVFATLNIGAGGANASTTRFYLSRNAVLDASDVAIATFAMPPLAAGQVRVDFLNPVIPANANGSYYVIASADDGHVVFESNEANNMGVSPWRISIR
jgi:CARDB protein